MAEDGRTLWLNEAQGRFFLVPDDAAIPEGTFAITNFTGETRKADAQSLARFEVSKDEAGRRAQGALTGLVELGKKGDFWGKLQDVLGEIVQAMPENLPDEPTAPEPEDVANGLRFVHVLEMDTKRRIAEVSAGFRALLDTLLEAGLVDEEEFRARLDTAIADEGARMSGDAMVAISDVPDKYAIKPVEIDCEARLPLCKARCCTFSFALSTQDLDERVVRWDYGRPYEIARGADGYCVHNCTDALPDETPRRLHLCTIYEQRPASCRTFDCRGDKRIWEDFDKKIPAK